MTLSKKATKTRIKPLNRVHINIRGYPFETMKGTLQIFPETLLGDAGKRAKYYCPYRNAYCFDRNWLAFESILYFYQSRGKLYRPPDIDICEFIDECQFFQLPEWAINGLKREEHTEIDEMVHAALLPPIVNSDDRRGRFLVFFEHPASSRWANAYFVFSMGLIITSITAICSHRISDDNENHREIVILSVNIFFFGELVIRVFISKTKLKLFKKVSTWFEIMALILSILIRIRSTARYVFGLNSCIQILRIYILVGKTRPLRLIYVLFKVTSKDIINFMTCFGMYILFGAALIFMLETEEQTSMSSQFTSIPGSAWWAIQTFTTVGYGDIVPVTTLGKVFASMYMMIVIPTIWVLLTPFTDAFKKYILT